jgi:hypothetical protein
MNLVRVRVRVKYFLRRFNPYVAIYIRIHHHHHHHEPDARVEEVKLKSRQATGPSWPDNTSSSRPVCRDHT